MNNNRCVILYIFFFLLICPKINFGQITNRSNMVLVPAGKFKMQVEYRNRESMSTDTMIIDDAGSRYRSIKEIFVHAFYIDKTEVTNEQFKIFLDASGYQPKCPKNFLKHWRKGTYPKGKGKHPVVWVSLADAKAYAKWARKRLPTEVEWQKAAQGTDGRTWPWGNLFDPNKANMDSHGTKPVGSYPDGSSPYGCLEMAGNVWEWTDSFQSDGYQYFTWIRGGSYFLAKGSQWYMDGGAVTNYQRAKFLMMNPALNRCATIGFRCVKDVE